MRPTPFLLLLAVILILNGCASSPNLPEGPVRTQVPPDLMVPCDRPVAPASPKQLDYDKSKYETDRRLHECAGRVDSLIEAIKQRQSDEAK